MTRVSLPGANSSEKCSSMSWRARAWSCGASHCPCNANCTAVDLGYTCLTPGQACVQCGNGIIEAGEVCDDGNLLSSVAGRAWLYAPDGEPKNATIVEQAALPGMRRAVRHTAEMKFSGGVEAFTVETVEERCGSGAIEAAIVKTEPYAGHVEPERAFLATVRIFRGAKLLTMQVGHSEVKRKSARRKI